MLPLRLSAIAAPPSGPRLLRESLQERVQEECMLMGADREANTVVWVRVLRSLLERGEGRVALERRHQTGGPVVVRLSLSRCSLSLPPSQRRQPDPIYLEIALMNLSVLGLYPHLRFFIDIPITVRGDGATRLAPDLL